MKKLALLLLSLTIFNISFAGKDLPKDVLDKNVALSCSFSPPKSFKGTAVMKQVKAKFLKMGFNIVHVINTGNKKNADNFVKEIENKNVVYNIGFVAMDLGTSVVYSMSIVNQSKAILYSQSNGNIDKLFSKVEKDILKFKDNNPTANKAKYDLSLINKTTLVETEEKTSNKVVSKGTLNNDQEPIKYDFNYLPKDLKTSKVYYYNVQSNEYPYNGIINKSVKNKMAKYPFDFQIFVHAGDMPSDFSKMNENGYKYRLKLQKINEMYVKTTTYTSKPAESEGMAKDHFLVYFEEISTGKLFSSEVKSNFISGMMKDFVQKVNEKYNIKD